MTSLPHSSDVVIVGGGVMGASAAFHLAESGVSVVLLERDSLASGSTSKAAGGVRASFTDPLNIALGARSLALLRDFPTRPGQDIDLHESGYLYVLTREEHVDQFRDAMRWHAEFGVPTELVDADTACRLSPLLDPSEVIAALWSPRDGHCTPESVVLGYARGARMHGAVVSTGVEVTGVVMDGRAITSVQTSAGEVATNCVIDCAGVWAPSIALLVGLDLPVVPVRRELLITEPMHVPLEMAFTIDFATSLYWHREGPGLLTGFSDHRVVPGWSLDRDPTFPARLAELAASRAPRILDLGVRSGWAGYYEVTPDHNALIGEWSGASRFLYATGFSGHGFMLGPAVGEVLRDLVLGVQPGIDVSALRVDRFAEGVLRPEHAII